jgi:hypothetical protein
MYYSPQEGETGAKFDSLIALEVCHHYFSFISLIYIDS